MTSYNRFKTLAPFLCLLSLLILSFTPAGSKWTAPATADAVKNPQKDNAAAAAEGKKTYQTLCAICHGAGGKGDGVAAAGLSKSPADHTSAAIQAQTDGALYWKLTEGNNPMPSYKTTLNETQRWQLINYIRTLAKPTKK